MRRNDAARALRQELGRAASKRLNRSLLRYIRLWQKDGDPGWFDLAVSETIGIGQPIPPTLQKIAGEVAKLRPSPPDCGYDGYMVHLAERALDQNPTERGPIDAIWRAAAENKLSNEDAAEWMSIIAKRVVKEVIEFKGPTKERPPAAIAALGLRGKIDKLYHHRRALKLFLDFYPLAKASEPRLSRPERLYRAMRSHYKNVPKADAKQRIDNLEKSVKKLR